MRTLILLLLFATSANAQVIPSRQLSFPDYKPEMGFSFRPGILAKSQDGLVTYTLDIEHDWNRPLGVSLSFWHEGHVVGRVALPSFDSPAIGKRPAHTTVEFELAPEIAKDARLTFQLYPNTEKVTFYQLQVATWPVMVFRADKTRATVPLEEVAKSLATP